MIADARFEEIKDKTYYPLLQPASRDFLHDLYFKYRFTFQEFRWLTEAARDMEMWGGEGIEQFWGRIEQETPPRVSGADDNRARKRDLLRICREEFIKLQRAPKDYSASGGVRAKPKREPLRAVSEDSDKKIHGDCPVASPETVCCNLKTIDAVENCVFGCSYCTIQTFYGNEAVIDSKFRKKLERIEIDPGRFYHFGTGQSSDSLVWGNRQGILDDLCGFARKHPNILLEFKTKSEQVRYFLETDVPENVVCSWSLNPQTVIENEEHFTAGLEARLAAARKVADRGIAVAFHFHPIVYFEGWESGYRDLVQRVQSAFKPEEVLFISFGSVTFIKPVMQQIRKRGEPTKILQMELVPTAKGKLSYPAEIKVRQFRFMDDAFQPWKEKVFMYLCMEPPEIWDAVWGGHYPDNETFEKDFGAKTMRKVKSLRACKV